MTAGAQASAESTYTIMRSIFYDIIIFRHPTLLNIIFNVMILCNFVMTYFIISILMFKTDRILKLFAYMYKIGIKLSNRAI